MRYRKWIFTFALLTILLILILKLDFFSWWMSASTATFDLDFLNYKFHSDPHVKMAYPEPFIHQPSAKHNSTLILLHGTSQDGPSFGRAFLSAPIQDNKTLPQLLQGTRFIFPTGRLRYCTVLGRESHAWFDFQSFSDRILNESSQIGGLSESTRYLSQLVKAEEKLLNGRGNLVLGGFSQGTAMSGIALLSGELGRISGFVGLSGWLPFRKQIHEGVFLPGGQNCDERARCVGAAMGHVRKLLDLAPTQEGGEEVREVLDVKAWFGHGEDDTKMRPDWGRDMAELLSGIGIDVTFKGYEGLGHWWNEKEMGDLVVWLRGTWNDDERMPLADVTKI